MSLVVSSAMLRPRSPSPVRPRIPSDGFSPGRGRPLTCRGGSALVRIPAADGAIRFEYRAGDAGANLYLHLVGLLAASLDGLSTQLAAPPVTTGAALTWTDEEATASGVARLPGTLGVALAELGEDDVLLTALGEPIADHYLAVKRHESAAHAPTQTGRRGTAEVSLWETMTYFAAL